MTTLVFTIWGVLIALRIYLGLNEYRGLSRQEKEKYHWSVIMFYSLLGEKL